MDASTCFVSVIIPNYNHAPYLEQRIESVLAQTHQHFEVLLLDDCSTDNSSEVINRYRNHEKVSQVIINSQNSGTTFKQWAKGIELAQYDWIWIAESDDWCEPTLLQTLVEGISETTCLAFCQSLMIKDNVILWKDDVTYLSKSYNGLAFIQSHMLRRLAVFNASMCIFKRAHYYSVSSAFTSYRLCGDWLFWISIAQQGDVFSSGKVLNYFRKHDKDVSGPAIKSGLLYLEYIKLVHELERSKIIDYAKRMTLTIYKFNEFLLDNRVEYSHTAAVKEAFYQEIGSNIFSINAYKALGKKNGLRVMRDKLFGNFG